jgi:hypothetical protein
MLNGSREWQNGCTEQTMIATRGDKFIIGHEASKKFPLLECVIGREASKNASHWRTLSLPMDFDHQGSQ